MSTKLNLIDESTTSRSCFYKGVMFPIIESELSLKEVSDIPTFEGSDIHRYSLITTPRRFSSRKALYTFTLKYLGTMKGKSYDRELVEEGFEMNESGLTKAIAMHFGFIKGFKKDQQTPPLLKDIKKYLRINIYPHSEGI